MPFFSVFRAEVFFVGISCCSCGEAGLAGDFRELYHGFNGSLCVCLCLGVTRYFVAEALAGAVKTCEKTVIIRVQESARIKVTVFAKFPCNMVAFVSYIVFVRKLIIMICLLFKGHKSVADNADAPGGNGGNCSVFGNGNFCYCGVKKPGAV